MALTKASAGQYFNSDDINRVSVAPGWDEGVVAGGIAPIPPFPRCRGTESIIKPAHSIETTSLGTRTLM